MISFRQLKNLNNYVKIDQSYIRSGVITVEHRSNNKKRDYLFVNKCQCKHIPTAASNLRQMTASLSYYIDDYLKKTYKKKERYPRILAIGFAETATAIAMFLAESNESIRAVTCTTRENFDGFIDIVNFEEKHSHATEQKLVTTVGSNVDIRNYDAILFVEDEITTGNTILNFIEALKEKGYGNKKFMVASICNWQDKESEETYRKNGIDTISLIKGSIKDINAKMGGTKGIQEYIEENCYYDFNHMEETIDSNFYKYLFEDIEDYTLFDYDYSVDKAEAEDNEGCNLIYLESQLRTGVTKQELRTIHNYVDVLSKTIADALLDKGIETCRVIGTEEFMYIPSLIADKLTMEGVDTLCHSTTRSKIDVINCEFDGEQDGIKNRLTLPSAYSENRETYLYNLKERTDIIILVTDSRNDKQVERLYKSLRHQLRTNSLYLIRL